GAEPPGAGRRRAELTVAAEAPPAAVEALAAGLAGVRGPDDYRNPLVPLAEARQLVQKAVELCRSKGAWDAAQKAAELFGRLAPPGGGDVMAGQTADEWAKALREQAK